MKPVIARRPVRTYVQGFAAVVATVLTLSGIGMTTRSTELPRSVGRPNQEGTSI